MANADGTGTTLEPGTTREPFVVCRQWRICLKLSVTQRQHQMAWSSNNSMRHRWEKHTYVADGCGDVGANGIRIFAN